MDYNEMIEAMASAFQEAANQPVTWVDAKRGMRAALSALQDYMPAINTKQGVMKATGDAMRLYTELKYQGKDVL